MRAVAEEIVELVAEFDGVNSSEHGDGLARSAFNPRDLRRRPLRGDAQGQGAVRPARPAEPRRDGRRAADDRGPARPRAARAARRCRRGCRSPSTAACAARPTAASGIGACRKTGIGVMCPSYMATREEEHATRGRANALVKALSSPDPHAALGDERLHEILDLCLECKACKSECPLSVDMATLKSEFLSHYQDVHGVPLRSRLFGAIRRAEPARRRARAASRTCPRACPARAALLERTLGIARRRPLPRFAREHLVRWDRRRAARASAAPRGEVVFLADSFTTYTEPAIGRAAIELLEAAGWRVRLESAGCCGRASISKGLLDQARETGRRDGGPARARRRARRADRRLRAVLPAHAARGAPQPAARRPARGGGRAPGAARRGAARRGDRRRRAAARPGLAGERPADRLPRPLPPEGARGHRGDGRAARAHPGRRGDRAGRRLLRDGRLVRLRGRALRPVDADRRVPPVPGAAGADAGALVAATGVSCRQQIAHGAGRRARHPVELVRAAL